MFCKRAGRCEIAFGVIGVAGLSAVHLAEEAGTPPNSGTSCENLSNLEVQNEEVALWCKHQMLVAKHVNRRPKRQDLSFSHVF